MRSTGDERKAGKRLGELYAEHAAAVYAYAFHLLGTREEAEDVVQIAFLHAHRSLVRGEDLVHPRAWLSTVVKRQAFNRWRDRRELPVEDPAVDLHAAEPGEAAEQLSQVRAVLFSLPEAQHQAFVLRHWSGLSTREIGQVLGTTESAAESLLMRARASILAAGPVADECVDIREKLAAGADLSGLQVRHVARCSGCTRARRRLTRIAAASVALGLVPHAHVAQALAASVPGFAVAGASAGAGAGAATGAGLAAKGGVAKVAASLVISAVAVTAVAPLALHAAHHLHDGPVARPVHARSVIQAAAVVQGTPGARPRGVAVTGDGTSGNTPGASTKDGGSGSDGGGASSDGSSSQSSGSSDGSGGSGGSSQTSSGDGSGGSSQTSSGDGTSQSGSDGSGSADSGNVTSGGGSTSTDGGSTSGDSPGSSTDGSGGQ